MWWTISPPSLQAKSVHDRTPSKTEGSFAHEGTVHVLHQKGYNRLLVDGDVVKMQLCWMAKQN